MPAVTESYSARTFAASGNVAGRACLMGGITFATGGTVAVYDDVSTGTGVPVILTTNVVAGQYLAVPAALSNGCNIVVGGGATGTAWII